MRSLPFLLLGCAPADEARRPAPEADPPAPDNDGSAPGAPIASADTAAIDTAAAPEGIASFFLARGSSAEALELWPSRGDGTFDPPIAVAAEPGLAWTTPVIADLDADGLLEFVVTSEGGEDWWFDRAAADAPFVGAPLADLPFAIVGAADLDGDGALDLYGWTGPEGVGGVALGDGAGGFTPREGAFDPTLAWPGPHRALAPRAADLTADGVPDLVVASHGDALWQSSQVHVYPGVGDGTFLAPLREGSNFWTPLEAIDLGDLDGDGDLDVVAGLCDEDDPGKVFSSRNQAPGLGPALPLVDVVRAPFAAPEPKGVGGGALGLHDWDGDGRPELLTFTTTEQGAALEHWRIGAVPVPHRTVAEPGPVVPLLAVPVP